MKLTRKEIRKGLPDSDSVIVIHNPGERVPEGKRPMDVRVVRACFFTLLDKRVLHDMCRTIGFQPPGFRLEKMNPAELLSHLIRHVQQRNLTEAPLIDILDDAAMDVAQGDPSIYKMEILSPPNSESTIGRDSECWAAAIWLKSRAGGLDEGASSELARLCDGWMREPVLQLPSVEALVKVFQGRQTAEKAKKKISDWRGRALAAEKELEGARSAKITFERDLQQAKAEIRGFREEIGKLQIEIGRHTGAQKQVEAKCSRLQTELKAERAKIAGLELKANRTGSSPLGAQEGAVPSSEHHALLLDIKARLELLQRTMNRLSTQNGSPGGGARGGPASHGNERAMSFVDVANLDWAAQKYFGRRIDYERLARYLSSRTPTGRSRSCQNVAFLCIERGASSDGFAQRLRSFGYHTVTRPLKVFPDGNTKGNVDVQLAVYAMSHVNTLDTAVIVSGDGDFASLALQLKSLGKRVEVLAFENLGIEMRDVVDEVSFLDDRILLPGLQSHLDWDGVKSGAEY